MKEQNKRSFFNNFFSSIMRGKKQTSSEKEKQDELDKFYVKALGGDKPPEATPETITPVPEPPVTLKKGETLESIARALTDDPVPYLRKNAAEKLGQLGDKRAIEYLLKGIKDENFEVRMYSARSLGKLADETLVEKLINTLKDSNEYLRDQTVEVLVNMGSIAVPPLINILKSNNWMLPYCAVKALGRIRDERALKALVDLLGDDRNVYVQRAVVESLEKIGEEVEDELARGLEHEVWYVKEKAAKILAKKGTPKSIEILEKAIEKESDEKLKLSLQECLGTLKSRFKRT